MFDTALYQQVLGLTSPWKVTHVRLDVESTEIHVHVEHPEGCRWNCPQCSRELACYDHAPERQWRHLNTCQFHTLVHARIPRVECPEHGVVQVKVSSADRRGAHGFGNLACGGRDPAHLTTATLLSEWRVRDASNLTRGELADERP